MIRRKCEPFGPVGSPNLHIYVLIEIFIKKCDVESVTFWVQLTDQTFTTIINRNFAPCVLVKFVESDLVYLNLTMSCLANNGLGASWDPTGRYSTIEPSGSTFRGPL